MSFRVIRLCALLVCFCVGKSRHNVIMFGPNQLLTFAAILIDKSSQSMAVIANRNALNDDEEDDLDMRGLLEENVQEVLEVPLTGEYEDDNKPSKEIKDGCFMNHNLLPF